MDNKHTIDHLIARAKILASGKIKNKGRPRTLMEKSEAETVSIMRKRGCSINSIFSVMREEKMTKYSDYPKFKAAYYNYRLHS